MSVTTRSPFVLLTALTLLVLSPAGGAFADEADAEQASPPATRAAVDTQVGDIAGELEAQAAVLNAPVATASVEKLHEALLKIMRSADQLGYEGRFDTLMPVVGETFDMAFMASKSVGRHWKKLDEANQTRWQDLFSRHITANYAGQFTGYTGEAFQTLGEEAAIRDTRVVRTLLTRPDDEDVQLNYRLREVDGEWRIIDIYLNGTVSELALRRSEYSSVLKREGFEKLMDTIDEKVKELASGSTS